MPRTRIGLLLVALSVVVPSWAFAGEPADNNPRAIEEVKAVDIGVWEAGNACDKDRWSALVADDVALITPYGFILNKTQLLNSTTLACTLLWKIEPVKVQIYGNVAIVVGNHTYTSKPDKKGHPGRYLYTRVYEKRNSRWQWVFGHHHIITDETSYGGHLEKEILTEKDKAVLLGWK